MREIEGIEEVVAKLEPHFPTIQQHFERENDAFINLISSAHDTLGRVLKCHLVVEHYVDRFLLSHFQIDNFHDVRLSFAQKAALLPNTASAAAFVKPGVLQLNKIRNRFGHSLGAELLVQDLGSIGTVLEVARPGRKFESPVAAIAAFTAVAAAFLIVPPPSLQSIFTEAFRAVRVRPDVHNGEPNGTRAPEDVATLVRQTE